MRPQEVEKYARALLIWNADFASSHAARRAFLFTARGDDESAAAWLTVRKRIRALQAHSPAKAPAARANPQSPEITQF